MAISFSVPGPIHGPHDCKHEGLSLWKPQLPHLKSAAESRTPATDAPNDEVHSHSPAALSTGFGAR